MEQNGQHNYTYLQRISNILLINGGFLDDPGLYTGEMGIVLFFSRYTRFTHNDLYLEYSIDLIEKTQNRIHTETSINYKHGLAGIGSAVEYLVQNNFFEADTDDILEEFDERIFFTYNLPYLSIDKIMDIGYYALWRISGNSLKKDVIRQTILPPIVRVMENWSEKNNLTHPSISFFKNILSSEHLDTMRDGSGIPLWLQLCRKHSPYSLGVKLNEAFLDNSSKNNFSNLISNGLGIQNGLAGLGLSLLTELDSDDSWISLFPNDLKPLKDESLPV